MTLERYLRENKLGACARELFHFSLCWDIHVIHEQFIVFSWVTVLYIYTSTGGLNAEEFYLLVFL